MKGPQPWSVFDMKREWGIRAGQEHQINSLKLHSR